MRPRLRSLSLVIFALCSVLAAPPVVAQPMMDPSQMSGIPRPDPQVPAGTITVRLIRGEMQNRIADTEVELVSLSAAGAKRAARTDAEGRATFAEVAAGTYEARASLDGEALASQPIELSGGPGIRVMLVFSKSLAEQQKELGTPDGKARVNQDLAAGSLLVQVIDGDGRPLAGATVVVNHGDRDTEKVNALPEQKTGDDGQTRFTGLPTGAGDAYLLTVVHKESRLNSKPFRLVANHGSQLALQVRPVTQDVTQVVIANGSHLIFELNDDMVQVMENLILKNAQEQTVTPGPEGLRLPLPVEALSAQVIPGDGGEAPPAAIDMSRRGAPAVVWKGPIPPGQHSLRIGFVLRQSGRLRFRQETPLRYEGLRVIIEKTSELRVDGPGVETEERKFNGRDLLLVNATPPQVGGLIELTLTGLPYDLPIYRYLAALISLLLLLVFGGLAWRGRPQHEAAAAQRARLLERRQVLLEQILALDRAAEAGRKKKGESRETLMAELEQVYRDLEGREQP